MSSPTEQRADQHARTISVIIVMALLLAPSGCRQASGQVPPTLTVRNSAAMQLMVVEENRQPTLRIVLPDHPTSDRAIEILFPEHLTVRLRGSTDAKAALPLSTGASRRATDLATVRAIPGVRETPSRRRSYAGSSNPRSRWRSLSLQAQEPVRRDV